MDVARRLADIGLRGGLAVAAGEQRRGRGRLGRTWVSPRGGLWLSVLLRPRLDPKRAKLLGLVASLAVAKALSALGIGARILWPNDVVVGGKRICGVLVEAKAVGPARLEWAIVGIGLNLNFPSAALPDEVRARATTVFDVLGTKLDQVLVLDSILDRLREYCRALELSRVEEVVSECSRALYGVGRTFRATLKKGVIEGILVGIGGEGDLLLKTERGVVRVEYNELERLVEL